MWINPFADNSRQSKCPSSSYPVPVLVLIRGNSIKEVLILVT